MTQHLCGMIWLGDMIGMLWATVQLSPELRESSPVSD